ncbi:hypothetical protein EIP91_002743 [Steccherinum ochraceum]|uniref:UvrD-like helicase C-terminal domain-containing protein n=1 Tax=Steccherinum ochraceum TaxID=92696 RepID=A0A4R0RK32_9APHY|nr:hypothetical protein EIP91_002743 [Steccherinum ochraceum]
MRDRDPSPTQLRVLLDTDAFRPPALREEVSLEVAMSILGGHLQNPAVDREQLVFDILDVPKLFPFVISSVSASVVASLVDWLTAGLPRTSDAFRTSLHNILMGRLSQFYWELKYPYDGLQDGHKLTQQLSTCLNALDALSFTAIHDHGQVSNATEGGLLTKRFTTQRQIKKQRSARGSYSTVDPQTFKVLGYSVPTSATEAADLTTNILLRHLSVLTRYIQVLNYSTLAPLISEAYLATFSSGTTSAEANVIADMPLTTSATTDEGNEPVHVPDDPPPASLHVQPLKAALHFESAEGFGNWRIHITSRAESDLRIMRKKNVVLFDIILKKLKELSFGHFSKDNHKRLDLPASDIEIPIYEAKMTGNSRLVYQIDCVKEYNENHERQVLRIFGVYTHEQMRRNFWEAVSNSLGGKGADYRARCNFRSEPHNFGDNVVPPMMWPQRTAHEQPSIVRLPEVDGEDALALHALLTLDKLIPLSQAMLSSIRTEQELSPVYLLSPDEQEIVFHGSSCYVLGRSGTGSVVHRKTTTILFKIFGIERAWEQYRQLVDENIPRPRQVFVTQSQHLAMKVEETYTKLARVMAMEHHDYNSIHPDVAYTEGSTRVLLNMDEQENSALPSRFSALEEKHFPLFISYSLLCQMLEADFKPAAPVHAYKPTIEFSSRLSSNSLPAGRSARQNFVSYSTFLSSYWNHFPPQYKKQYDPSQVFAEFMGVIKGSERALQTRAGYLQREEYQQLGRRIGTFQSDRSVIYDLFQLYLVYKRRRGEYDAADRTYRIYCGLREDGLTGRKVDFVYVDEVQDNLLTDSFILRSICGNPNGLFWAGDTAQTISAGSSFKFNELKAFQWRLEKASSQGRQSDNPQMFQLTKNYRSHGGIIKCAKNILDLITQFWPDAIDQISDETDITSGDPPVFYTHGLDEDSAGLAQFLFGTGETRIEFGAHQCILVRDKLAKHKLRQQVGEGGIILTLYESKGLEFDDVLLYNFFEDSTVDLAMWSVILNALPQPLHHCPRFDKTRYGGVCHELKCLYVAVTRARHNLWIADRSSRSKPLRDIWDSHNLIHIPARGDPVPQLASASTAEEWVTSAHQLFEQQNYEEAARAFNRAGRPHARDVAVAFQLREAASALPPPSNGRASEHARTQAFLSAARAFDACANTELIEAMARGYFTHAGDCYVLGGDPANAADAYLAACRYTEAAQSYRKAGLFSKAVRVVQTCAVSEKTADAILTVAKIHYISSNNLAKAMPLFPSEESAITFMQERGFLKALAEVLHTRNRLAEAAELQLSQGNVVEAIRLFVQDIATPTSLERAKDCILKNMRRRLPLGTTVDVQRDGCRELMQMYHRVENILRPTESNTVSHFCESMQMCKLILSRDYQPLHMLGMTFLHKHQDKYSALLCLDSYFSVPMAIHSARRTDVATLLEAFLVYARGLQQLVSNTSSFRKPAVQQLLGFGPSPEDPDMFEVYEESPLGRIGAMSAAEVSDLLKSFASMRLLKAVQQEDQCCQESLAFRPCSRFTLFQECKERDCSRDHSASPEGLDLESFHAGVRIVFQQILVCQTASSILARPKQLTQRRFWLSALFHLLYPPHRRLISIAALDLTRVPEASQAAPVIAEWIRDVLHNVHACVPTHSFLTAATELIHLAFAFDPTGARQYLSRIPAVSDCPSPIFRRDENKYVVHDLLKLLDPSSEYPITSGILFFARKLSIDISILCRLLDWICSSIIVYRQMRRVTPFHNTTLPKSWLVSSLSSLSDRRSQDLAFCSSVYREIPNLLAAVYYGTRNFLRFEDRQLGEASYQVREMFLMRICQAVSLLGYNTRMAQGAIYNEMAAFPRSVSFPRFSRPYRRYFESRSFQGLVRALRDTECQYGSPLDQLIQLKNEAKLPSGLVHSPVGTHTLIFRAATEIHDLLVAHATLGSAALGFQDTAHTPGDPLSELRSYDEDQDEAQEREPESRAGTPTLDDLEEGENHDDDQDHDAATIMKLVNASNIIAPAAPPTEIQVASAEKLKVAYRKMRWRRRQVNQKKRNAVDTLRDHIYSDYLKVSQGLQLFTKYRVLFLGPLPHLMVCLERAIKNAQATKKKTLLRFSQLNAHEEIESVQEDLDRATNALRALINAKELLKPTSTFHSHPHAHHILKEHAKDVINLLREIRGSATKEWAWDLRMSVKGIISEKSKKMDIVVD